MSLMLPDRQLFIVDTHVNLDPNAAEHRARSRCMAAEEMRRFGIAPKVALLSHSNFGRATPPRRVKMRTALALLQARAPELEVDGEMHGDCALDEGLRTRDPAELDADRRCQPAGHAELDAANIAYNLLKAAAGNNIAIGPILLGGEAPIHILTPSATVRRIVNMTALIVLEANAPR